MAIPPSFKDFGSAFKNLLDGFCYKNKFLVKNNQSPDFVVTTGRSSKAGHIDITYDPADKDIVAEGKLRTNGDVRASLKLKNVAPGLCFSLKAEKDATSSDSVVKQGKAVASAKLREAGFTGTLDLTLAGMQATSLKATAALGDEGEGDFTVGAGFLVDLKSDETDFNVGVEYTNKDFTASLRSFEQGEALRLSWHLKLSQDSAIGARVDCSPDDEQTMIFAGKTRLASDTILKARIASDGILQTRVTRTFAGPKLQLGATVKTQLSSSPWQSLVPLKYGFSVSLGDF